MKFIPTLISLASKVFKLWINLAEINRPRIRFGLMEVIIVRTLNAPRNVLLPLDKFRAIAQLIARMSWREKESLKIKFIKFIFYNEASFIIDDVKV